MVKNTRNNKKKAKTNLDQQVYQKIRQMLFYNEINPGQNIRYQDLAKRLNVSITPVIHAMKWLEFRGIVRHETNRGYFINEVSFQEINEIYDTRILLEISLVPETIKHLDDDGIQQLNNVLEEYKKSVDEENYYARLMVDMKFHITMASLSQCRIQLKMLQELFDLLLLKYSRNLVTLSIMDSSQQEHFQIFKELQNKNISIIQKILADHLQNVKFHISDGFKKMVVKNRELVGDLY